MFNKLLLLCHHCSAVSVCSPAYLKVFSDCLCLVFLPIYLPIYNSCLWADAGHSVIPPTGEGFNSGAEDVEVGLPHIEALD
jgi:hypothetical protein